MAWSSLQPNQMVTKNDAAESGFPLKPNMIHRSGNECCTKNYALTTYELSPSAMSSYANNELVPKSAWVSGVIGFPYLVSVRGFFDELGADNQACGLYGDEMFTLYSPSSSLQVPMGFYNDAGLTDPFNGGNFWRFFKNEKKAVLISRDVVGTALSISNCTPPGVMHGLAGAGPSGVVQCGASPGQYSYVYAAESFIDVGVKFYSDPYLSIPVTISGKRYCNSTIEICYLSEGEVTYMEYCAI